MSYTARVILEIINILGILITIYFNFLRERDREKLIRLKSHGIMIQGLVIILLGLGFFIFTIITVDSWSISRTICFTLVGIILVMGGRIMIKHRKKMQEKKLIALNKKGQYLTLKYEMRPLGFEPRTPALLKIG